MSEAWRYVSLSESSGKSRCGVFGLFINLSNINLFR